MLQDSSIPMELQVFFGWGVVGEDDVYVHYIQIETNSMNAGNLRTFEICKSDFVARSV